MVQLKRGASSHVFRSPVVHSQVLWERLSRWVRQHSRLLQLGAGGLIVLLVCGIAWSVYWNQRREHGLAELRGGIAATKNGKLDEAVSHFELATHRLPDGAARQLALVLLGKSLMDQGQAEGGRDTYKQALAIPSGESSLLSQVALLEVGRYLEREGDLAGARQHYEQATDLEGPLRGAALLAVARVLGAMAEQEAAASYYEKFVQEHAESPLIEVVRDRIREVKK